MNTSICGANCGECQFKNGCKGCVQTDGCPFGKQCFVAKYILNGGKKAYNAFKQGLIDEINALEVAGMAKVTELYPLLGSFVNLEYPLPNGAKVKLLKDDEIYLGAQVESLFDDSKRTCCGVVARENFILVCEYGENCTDPQIVFFKRR